MNMRNFRFSFYIILILSAFSSAVMPGFSQEDKKMDGTSFKSVSMEHGTAMMHTQKDYIILDVRRPDEYSAGHIPGAVLLTNETINKKTAGFLTDKNQLILVYCRSGRRSKEAAAKLAALGYTNIVEFGGIIDWKGPVEK